MLLFNFVGVLAAFGEMYMPMFWFQIAILTIFVLGMIVSGFTLSNIYRHNETIAVIETHENSRR